ncbi:MAG: NAD(P)-dependent oxidoreductase [Verrucomicrobiae bacterium]|nr:NAD(P)-dependent oxidoreductase [Verrucomicrobiae bacterium]
MRVTVIGAKGFVGSAFVRLLKDVSEIELVEVTRETFGAHCGIESDVVIEAACNSRKYLADQDPAADFQASAVHRLESLLKYPARLHVHISSVDVYPELDSPCTTTEDALIDPSRCSRYGFHKWLTEQLVLHYAKQWLIFRLAGMVGPGLKKNPVYDILHGQPLRVHPDSRYQYMHTDDVARICWELVRRGFQNKIFNICGTGTVTMRRIAELAGRPLNLSLVTPDMQPRIVDVSNALIRQLFDVPETETTLRRFFESYECRPRVGPATA